MRVLSCENEGIQHYNITFAIGLLDRNRLIELVLTKKRCTVVYAVDDMYRFMVTILCIVYVNIQ